MVVALAVTREGLPVRSWVLPGNKTDVKTVERVKRDLRGWKLGRTLFVADSGMNSADNRQELVKACGQYLQVDDDGKLLLDRAAVRKAERMDGKWVLLTNDDTLSLEDAASAYNFGTGRGCAGRRHGLP